MPQPEWLVDDTIQLSSLGMLYSESGLGKTFVMLDIACHVAMGKPWMGKPVKQGKVLFIAAEGQTGLGKRILAWNAAHNERVSGIHWLVNDVGKLNHFEIKSAIASVVPNPALVVIDTLNRTSVGMDENSAKDMGEYLDTLEQLRVETGAAVVVIHHTGHIESTRPRGSSTIMPTMDTLINLSQKDGILRLSCDKQKDAEKFQPMYIRLQHSEDSLVVMPSQYKPSLEKKVTAKEQMVTVINGQSLTAGQWQKLVPSISERQFFRVKSELEASGMVVEADGKFHFVP